MGRSHSINDDQTIQLSSWLASSPAEIILLPSILHLWAPWVSYMQETLTAPQEHIYSKLGAWSQSFALSLTPYSDSVKKVQLQKLAKRTLGELCYYGQVIVSTTQFPIIWILLFFIYSLNLFGFHFSLSNLGYRRGHTAIVVGWECS